MYWHYVRHNIKPSDFFTMGMGERIIMRACFLKEIEEEEKLKDQLDGKRRG